MRVCYVISQHLVQLAFCPCLPMCRTPCRDSTTPIKLFKPDEELAKLETHGNGIFCRVLPQLSSRRVCQDFFFAARERWPYAGNLGFSRIFALSERAGAHAGRTMTRCTRTRFPYAFCAGTEKNIEQVSSPVDSRVEEVTIPSCCLSRCSSLHEGADSENESRVGENMRQPGERQK